MGGKRYLQIKVCTYSVTGESFCSSLKQNLQKVYYELNLQSSEDCPLVFLMGMQSNLRVHNSCIYQAGLLSLMDDSLINSIQRVLHKTNKHNWISEVNVYDSLKS